MTTFAYILPTVEFFFLIAVGFVTLRKSNLRRHHLAKLFHVCIVAVFLFYYFISGIHLAGIARCRPMLVITFCIYAFYAILFAVLSVVFKVHKKRRKVFQAMFAFINIPAIGFPLIGVYALMRSAYISRLLWWIVCWFGPTVFDTTDEKTGKAKFNPKRLINPVTVMVILALIVTLADIHVPTDLESHHRSQQGVQSVCMLYLGR